MINSFLSRLLVFFFFLSSINICLSQISGPISVIKGESATYTIPTTLANTNDYYWYWEVDGTNRIYNTYSYTYFFDKSGTNKVTCGVTNFKNWTGQYFELDVAVVDMNPIVQSTGCGQTVLQRPGNPPTGKTWYWQGKSAYGISTSLGSGATYVANQGSGIYYLRSRNADGTWAATPGSVYVSQIEPITWYQDTNGDGLGDPNVKIVSCAQPVGYVDNNGTLPNENYIRTISPQVGSTSIAGLTPGQKTESVTYFDGLGRTEQMVGVRSSGVTGRDIITHFEYDGYGRQSREYLPYAAATNGGLYRYSANMSTINYYNSSYYENTINPYSDKLLEASPLSRVLKQAAPGIDWKLGNGHEIKFDNQTNDYNEVKNFRVSLAFINNAYTPTLVDAGFYNPNELYKTITYDENTTAAPLEINGSTVEFKNKQGQVLLKRTYGTVGSGVINEKHDTYYVYDDYGNLTYVLPPKMEATTASITSITSQLINLGYQYKYDQKKRLVEKKLPGKGTVNDWEEIIYNKLDQPILTRDPNLKAQNKWLFTKYDVLGRVAYTGLINSSSTRTALQSAADGTSAQYVTQSSTATTIAGTTIHYNNGAYPILAATDEVHTINYYDNYSFDLNGASATGSYHVPITNVKGLATGSKVRVLGSTSWITNVNYYDAKGRSIYTYSKNDYLQTINSVNIKLDFVGKTLETTSKHERNGAVTIIVDIFTYDQAGRLTKQTQAINGAATPEIIVDNTYDELGQLSIKKVGGKTTQSRLQTVNYTYNIRGWLKGINDTDTSNSSITMGTGDLFGFQINYNNPSTGTKLYNGNIGQTFWKTASPADTSLKNYTYSYDALNRLKQATDNLGKLNETINYDKNGNITNLTRLGEIVGGSTVPNITNASHFGTMDDLTYTYDAGNRLMKVADAAPIDQYGFKDDAVNTASDTADDYTYDVNGNMKTDSNKGITAITYNHLNLPTQVTIGGANINYAYDATGVKQRKTANSITIDYAGGFIYESNVMKFFSQPEGYVAKNGVIFSYIYQYKDHLGNVRLSYGDGNNDGAVATSEIIEENNYYPFGLKHKGYNNTTSLGKGDVIAQKYKYNGKELQDENIGGQQLNVYAYGWRDYDPAIGRFNKIDRFSEKYYNLSNYSYAGNNPIFFVDVQGDSISAGSVKRAERMERRATEKADRLERRANSREAKGKGVGDMRERVAELRQSGQDIRDMRSDPNIWYSFEKVNSSNNPLRDTNGNGLPVTLRTGENEITMFMPSFSNMHEPRHGGQIARGDYNINGIGLAGRPTSGYGAQEEISAYRAQYASMSGMRPYGSLTYLPSFTPNQTDALKLITGQSRMLDIYKNYQQSVININNIDSNLLRNMYDTNGFNQNPIYLNYPSVFWNN